MNFSELMNEVKTLEERFLKSDEGLDQIPKQETAPEERDEQEEVILMGELVFNAAQNAFELIRMLKKSTHAALLKEALGESAASALDGFQAACEEIQEVLGASLYALPAETGPDGSGDAEEDSEVASEEEEEEEISDEPESEELPTDDDSGEEETPTR